MASNYTKTVWTNNSLQPINKTNLDKIEQGIADAQDGTKIKQWYEAEDDTNAYTDADKTAVGTIATLTEHSLGFAPYYNYSVEIPDPINSEAWVETNRLTTGTLPIGVYQVLHSVVCNYNSIVNSGYCRISPDGGTTWMEFNNEPKDIADNNLMTCARPLVLTEEGIIDVIVQHRCELATDTLTIAITNLILERKL